MDFVMMVLFFREGPNPERFIFIYNSHLLYQISSNINIVTEWIANEGRDSVVNVYASLVFAFQ